MWSRPTFMDVSPYPPSRASGSSSSPADGAFHKRLRDEELDAILGMPPHNKVRMEMSPMVSTPHQSPDHAACAASNLQNAPMQTTPFCATPVAASCGAGSELVRHLGLRWGSHRAQGPRSYQEDRTVVRLAEAAEEPHAYFGVFDGHGGAEAADYAVEHLHPNLMRSAFADVGDALRDAYLRTDAGVLAAAAAIPKKKASNAGAAAVTMLAHARRLVLAHAGDCRALLVKRSGMFVELTRDHSAEDDPAAPVPTPLRPDEVARIARAGARVESGYVHVDDESLPMTRALGDLRLKVAAGLDWRATSTERQVVTALPDVATYERSDDDLCVVLASDGLWDLWGYQECLEHVFAQPPPSSTAQVKAACKELIETTRVRGEEIFGESADNITTIVVTCDLEPAA